MTDSQRFDVQRELLDLYDEAKSSGNFEGKIKVIALMDKIGVIPGAVKEQDEAVDERALRALKELNGGGKKR